MKTLRLIKPWRLKAVRQKLEIRPKHDGDGEARAMTCHGPEATNVAYKRLTNSRICINRDGRSENRAIAPASDAIFVLVNNRDKK